MVEKEIEGKKLEKRIDTFDIGEVATQTEIIIKNNSTGEIMNVSQALVLILNKIEKLERGLL